MYFPPSCFTQIFDMPTKCNLESNLALKSFSKSLFFISKLVTFKLSFSLVLITKWYLPFSQWYLPFEERYQSLL